MEALADAYVSGAGVPQDMEKASAWYRQAIGLGSGSAANALGVLYQSSDAAESLAWFEKAAAMNDPNGARNAGQAYARRGNLQDGAKAIYYLQKAADLGRAIALHDLGLLYEEGRAVRPDAVRARQFYEQAVERRVWDAVPRLADMYLLGRGIPKDEAKGLNVLRGAAERGDRDSAFTLASYYEKGLYVPADQQQQRYWLERAASRGKSDAYAPLAGMYLAGLGGPKDEARAKQLLGQAAERGDTNSAAALAALNDTSAPQQPALQDSPRAQCVAATRFLEGRGAPKDTAKGIELATKSASANDACGEQVLGSLYMRGEGVPLDKDKGMQLLRSSAQKGYAPALFELGLHSGTSVYNGPGVGVTPNLSLLRTNLEAAVARGDQMAAVTLGAMYASGKGVEKDGAKALAMWKAVAEDAKAPDGAVAQAAFNLAAAHLSGAITAVNRSEGERWLKIAVERGHPRAAVALANIRAQKSWRNETPPRLDSAASTPSGPEAAFSLGMQYLFGSKSVPRDDARAVSYFRQAAEGGSAAAQHNLGIMYFKGQGVAKDEHEAAKWLHKAADQNFVPALTLLSGMYGTGQGVPKEPMTALALRARIPPDQRKTNHGVEPSVVLQGELSKFSLGMRRGGFELKREILSGATSSLPPSPAPAPRESDNSVDR